MGMQKNRKRKTGKNRNVKQIHLWPYSTVTDLKINVIHFLHANLRQLYSNLCIHVTTKVIIQHNIYFYFYLFIHVYVFV